MKLVTAAEMRAIEESYLASTGSSIDDLMARAGRAVAGIASSLVEEPASISVFCGKGNNGGDGFVAARILSEGGYRLRVFKVAPDEDYQGPAKKALAALRTAGVSLEEFTNKPAPPADLVIDALLGFGLSGAPKGPVAKAVDAVNAHSCPILSVDVPTGTDSDTGAIHGMSVRADYTVTFTAPKLGLYLLPGSEYAGEVICTDIGIDHKLIEDTGSVELVDEMLARPFMPRIPKTVHKKNAGRVLMIAGSAGMTGAAVLAATGAMRGGAGICVLAAPRSLNDILEVKLTEVMTVGLAETDGRSLAGKALDQILEIEPEFDCVAVGPGLSRHPSTVDLVHGLIQRIQKPLVLDADGLYAASLAPDVLKNRQAGTIITPHSGELSSLIAVSVAEIEADRVGIARRVVKEFGLALIHKGFHSTIAAGERLGICETGNPGMATAGTGDVLTGVVAALTAKGLGLYEAAALAAYVHGLAGDLAVEELGPIATIAGDLLDYIPGAYEMLAEEW